VGSNLLALSPIKSKIQRFYDFGSPLYMKIYGQHIHDGYYIAGNESKKAAQENLIKLIVEKAAIKKGSKILDVGCGVGGSSIWLAKNLGATTTGITISPVQVELARKMAKEQKASSSFYLMDAENMHFSDIFDVIWTVAVMTHLQDQHRFLKSADNFLVKTGKLIIFDWMLNEYSLSLQNDRDVKAVLDGMLLPAMYSLGLYREWLSNLGYQVIYSEDITDHTVKTWDVALSMIKEPEVLQSAYRLTKDEIKEGFHFLKAVRAMKQAMQKGKVISGIVIARKM
jgi:tocopherol O-methyltransferase